MYARLESRLVAHLPKGKLDKNPVLKYGEGRADGPTLMKMLNAFTRPEYFFRPRQIFTRLRRSLSRAPVSDTRLVVLPWGSPIRIRPEEVIGRAIWHQGVYDLNVSECLWRVLEPGEHAVDVGANVGYMTSLMATRVGGRGMVVAIEPHPEIFDELQANATRWMDADNTGEIQLHRCALGESRGVG